MMSKHFYILLLSTLSFAINTYAASVTSSTLPHPFFFTENKGQWDDKVLYKCSARNGMTWFLERDGITLLTSIEDKTLPALPNPMDRDLPEMMRKHPARYPMKSHALKFKFLDGNSSLVGAVREPPANGRMPYAPTDEKLTYSGGSRTAPTMQTSSAFLPTTSAKSIDPQNELSWHNNYFIGNDSSKWAPDCRNYSSIIYREVWDGIDIEWYENAGKLEFDFVVQPGADPSQIRISCDGLSSCIPEKHSSSESINLVFPRNAAKDRLPQANSRSEETWGSTLVLGKSPSELLLPTSLGNLQMLIPACYQLNQNNIRSNDVTAEFAITTGNIFSITLPNGYDKSQILRIDPLVWSTYLGGSGADGSGGITAGEFGSIVLTGRTESANFPVTYGVFDSTFVVADCFITKLDSTGTNLIFSTFLGGSVGESSHGIVSDGGGGYIVTGNTTSYNFPTTNNAYQQILNGTSNCFVTRINGAGNRLIYSTYIGGAGNNGGDGGYAIASDGSGGAFVTGATTSASFPTTNGVFDRTINGGIDCYVTHLNNTGSSLLFSTYLGGIGSDVGYDIESDNHGGTIVTGYTSSTDFPTTRPAFDTVYHGGYDCFITHVNSTGTQLEYSTYLGGSGDDGIIGLIDDNNGSIIVTGGTNSPDFPRTLGTYDTSFNGGSDGFVARIDNTGTQLIFCCFIGGSGEDGARAIASDGLGGMVITGITRSVDLPTTVGSIDSTYNGGTYGDCFVARLSRNAVQLLYSTYLGGTGTDDGRVVFNDSIGSIIVFGETNSVNFPISLGAYDSTLNGNYDCFLTRIRFDSVDAVQTPDFVPSGFSLSQNYPNPFNSSTTISYSIPTASVVSVKMYDLTGREISTLVDQRQQAGSYRVLFDGKGLSSGTYFVKLQADKKFSKVQKLVLLK